MHPAVCFLTQVLLFFSSSFRQAVVMPPPRWGQKNRPTPGNYHKDDGPRGIALDPKSVCANRARLRHGQHVMDTPPKEARWWAEEEDGVVIPRWDILCGDTVYSPKQQEQERLKSLYSMQILTTASKSIDSHPMALVQDAELLKQIKDSGMLNGMSSTEILEAMNAAKGNTSSSKGQGGKSFSSRGKRDKDSKGDKILAALLPTNASKLAGRQDSIMDVPKEGVVSARRKSTKASATPNIEFSVWRKVKRERSQSPPKRSPRTTCEPTTVGAEVASSSSTSLPPISQRSNA